MLMIMTKTILGWGLIVFIGAVVFINALFMLVSPRAWFRLPGWIRAQGSLTEGKYARGWRAIDIRSTGAIMLGFIAWVLYHAFIRQPFPKKKEFVLVLSIILWCIVAVVAVHIAMNAAFMLASPRAWFSLPSWLRVQGPLTEQKHATGRGSLLVRLLGAVLLGVFGWVLYETVIKWWLGNS